MKSLVFIKQLRLFTSKCLLVSPSAFPKAQTEDINQHIDTQMKANEEAAKERKELETAECMMMMMRRRERVPENLRIDDIFLLTFATLSLFVVPLSCRALWSLRLLYYVFRSSFLFSLLVFSVLHSFSSPIAHWELLPSSSSSSSSSALIFRFASPAFSPPRFHSSTDPLLLLPPLFDLRVEFVANNSNIIKTITLQQAPPPPPRPCDCMLPPLAPSSSMPSSSFSSSSSFSLAPVCSRAMEVRFWWSAEAQQVKCTGKERKAHLFPRCFFWWWW